MGFVGELKGGERQEGLGLAGRTEWGYWIGPVPCSGFLNGRRQGEGLVACPRQKCEVRWEEVKLEGLHGVQDPKDSG